MSDKKDPQGAPRDGWLLPPSGSLLPPSAAPLDLAGGPEVAIGAQLEKAAGEARELAAKAAQLAAAKAPELRKKAEEATAQAGEAAGRLLHGAGEAAREARGMLADPARRQSFFARNGRKLAGGLGAVILLGAGGWFFACHQAGVAAHQAVDGFLAANHLSATVRYGDLSASPFGSVTLKDVVIGQGGPQISIGALRLAGIEMQNGQIAGIDLSAHAVTLPLAAWARQSGLSKDLTPLLGLGYASLAGDVGLSFHLDPAARTLSLESRGELADCASWKARMLFGGAGPELLAALTALPGAAGGGGLGLVGGGMRLLPLLSQATLVEYRATLDNSGYFRRAGEIPATDLPAGQASAAVPLADTPSLLELQQDGMTPAEIKANHEALAAWTAKGGKIAIENTTAQPVPLSSASGNFLGTRFLFEGFPRFVALTKARITL